MWCRPTSMRPTPTRWRPAWVTGTWRAPSMWPTKRPGRHCSMMSRPPSARAGGGVWLWGAARLLLPGGARPLIADLQLDTWERSFAVNARGAFLCSREWLRRRNALPVEHGRAVFFGSVAAQLGGYRSSAAYIAAKAAVMGYAK